MDSGKGRSNGYGDGYNYTNGAGYGIGYGYGPGKTEGDGYGYGGSDGGGYGGSDGCGNSHGSGTDVGFIFGEDDGDGYGCGYGDGSKRGDCNSSDDGLIYVAANTPILAWWRAGGYEHFGQSPDTAQGAIHEWPYKPELCRHGLHACWRREGIRCRKAPIYRVACSGWVRTDGGKLVCTRRVILDYFQEERR